MDSADRNRLYSMTSLGVYIFQRLVTLWIRREKVLNISLLAPRRVYNLYMYLVGFSFTSIYVPIFIRSLYIYRTHISDPSWCLRICRFELRDVLRERSRTLRIRRYYLLYMCVNLRIEIKFAKLSTHPKGMTT
jgi:hypothetical protein